MTDKTRPAFPCKQLLDIDPDTGRGKEINSSGMSLRDYLAAKAMQPMITYFGEQAFSDYSMNEISEEAYRMADAMLKVRG